MEILDKIFEVVPKIMFVIVFTAFCFVVIREIIDEIKTTYKRWKLKRKYRRLLK